MLWIVDSRSRKKLKSHDTKSLPGSVYAVDRRQPLKEEIEES